MLWGWESGKKKKEKKKNINGFWIVFFQRGNAGVFCVNNSTGSVLSRFECDVGWVKCMK